MNNKQIGALLFCTAGLVAAIGAASAQIAYAIVLGGFYAGNNNSNEIPAVPQNVNLHLLIIGAVIALATLGLFYLFRPSNQTYLQT